MHEWLTLAGVVILLGVNAVGFVYNYARITEKVEAVRERITELEKMLSEKTDHVEQMLGERADRVQQDVRELRSTLCKFNKP